MRPPAVLLLRSGRRQHRHSIFVSDHAGLAWETGLTWDPRVLQRVLTAIEEAWPQANCTVTGAWSDQRSAYSSARSTRADTARAASAGLARW
ncbi:hypothetical protein SAMN04488581_1283 [Mycolicibacterium neoaurum]|nr:hypothetical protein SAMN04488581_1283 [Mycolicibacterium neoaurum]